MTAEETTEDIIADIERMTDILVQRRLAREALRAKMCPERPTAKVLAFRPRLDSALPG